MLKVEEEREAKKYAIHEKEQIDNYAQEQARKLVREETKLDKKRNQREN